MRDLQEADGADGPPAVPAAGLQATDGIPPARTIFYRKLRPHPSGRRRSPPLAGPAAFGGSGAPCAAHSACLFRTSCGCGRTRRWRAHISMSIRSLPGCCSNGPETARRRRPAAWRARCATPATLRNKSQPWGDTRRQIQKERNQYERIYLSSLAEQRQGMDRRLLQPHPKSSLEGSCP